MNRSNALNNLRDWGVISFTFYYTHQLINRLIWFKVVRGMTLTNDTVNPPYENGDPDGAARLLSPNEVEEVVVDGPRFGLDMAFVREAHVRGDSCIGCFDGKVLASYGWYSDKPDQLNADLRLIFDRDYVYMYRGYTAPGYRGRRLHAKCMAAALRHFTDLNYRGLISYVDGSNVPALRSGTKLGYQTFGTILLVRLLGRYFIYHTRRCRDFGFRVQRHRKETSVGSYSLDTGGNSSSK
ncbi:MAG: GNAT family acetyltransferase [Gemmatimonadetes bacterium]|nr:GNAT family acetyltransferase [Gemmatimonadota bacterium]